MINGVLETARSTIAWYIVLFHLKTENIELFANY